MSSGFRQGPSRSIMLEIVTSPMVSVRIWSYLVCLLPWPNGSKQGWVPTRSYIAVSCSRSHFELMPSKCLVGMRAANIFASDRKVLAAHSSTRWQGRQYALPNGLPMSKGLTTTLTEDPPRELPPSGRTPRQGEAWLALRIGENGE